MARTITRPQATALRAAREDGYLSAPDFPAGHPLNGRYSLTVDVRTNTRDALVRLGLVEGIAHTESGADVTDYVLTYAGELIAVHCSDPESLPTLDTVAYYVANAKREETPERPNDGTYRPAEAGARTLRDARELWLNGKHVTANVEDSGTRLYVFLGTEMIYSGDMPNGIKTSNDVNTWVRQYATGYVWAAEYRTLWSYRIRPGRVWGPYADAQFSDGTQSAEEYCRGIVDRVGTGAVIRVDRRPESFDTTGRNWTDVHTVVYVEGDWLGLWR